MSVLTLGFRLIYYQIAIVCWIVSEGRVNRNLIFKTENIDLSIFEYATAMQHFLKHVLLSP